MRRSKDQDFIPENDRTRFFPLRATNGLAVHHQEIITRRGNFIVKTTTITLISDGQVELNLKRFLFRIHCVFW